MQDGHITRIETEKRPKRREEKAGLIARERTEGDMTQLKNIMTHSPIQTPME